MSMAGGGHWFVYVLRCADGSLYTGVTTDLTARVATHNRGKGAKYTRSRLPVKLVYSEAVADRSTAQRREYRIRRLSGRAKRRLVGDDRVSPAAVITGG